MKAIADTGFIVAFLHSDDEHHSWALEVEPALDVPALTCEAVLAEAAFHLRSSQAVMELVASGMLRVEFELQQQVHYLEQIAQRFSSRAPDLADLCLVRMSELFPRHTIVTVDESDFRVYRRNKREVIPILCPPRR